MIFPVLQKKNICKVLIIIGLGLILYAVISLNMWRFTQNEILKDIGEKTKIKVSVENIEKTDETKENSKKIKEVKESDIEIDKQTHNAIEREDYESGMMIISIPKLEVRAGVIKGTLKDDLKKGPGLYEISPLVNEEGGNVCIAGHRTTYGAWFRNVDKLIAGDDIFIVFNGFKYLYKVEEVFIVMKNDWSVTESTGYSALTLTACHPLKSAKQRIVVRAKLENSEAL